MLIDDRSLRLAETDEVDDVGEYLDQSVMGGFVKVGEGEVFNAALFQAISCVEHDGARVRIPPEAAF